jgi:hypothetical protein
MRMSTRRFTRLTNGFSKLENLRIYALLQHGNVGVHLPYEDVRKAATPDESVLAFMQSTYEAGARLAKWGPGCIRARNLELGIANRLKSAPLIRFLRIPPTRDCAKTPRMPRACPWKFTIAATTMVGDFTI